MPLAIVIIKFIVGCALLAWSADRFVHGSIGIARHFGMSSLMIGILLVGFGTSFPEMVVSGLAAYHGSPGLAIGNVVGSNIANVGLCLGVTALLAPVAIQSVLLKREFPVLMLITFGVWLIFMNGELSRIEGLALLLALVGYLTWLFNALKKKSVEHDPLAEEFQEEIVKHEMKLFTAFVWWFIGLALLFVSSELLVSSATTMARWFGVSDVVIGLTIVAIGTSLPELAATVVSAMKGEPDIALGNIIGSNVFNLLAVLIFPALIAPTELSFDLIWRDYPIMFGFTLAMWLFAYVKPNHMHIGRGKAVILLLGYAGFLLLQVLVA